jgi:hypothetical protein
LVLDRSIASGGDAINISQGIASRQGLALGGSAGDGYPASGGVVDIGYSNGGSAGNALCRALLVGDTATDRDTGRASGVPVALVTFGPEGPGVARLNPEALLERFEDLAAVAARLIR